MHHLFCVLYRVLMPFDIKPMLITCYRNYDALSKDDVFGNNKLVCYTYNFLTSFNCLQKLQLFEILKTPLAQMALYCTILTPTFKTFFPKRLLVLNFSEFIQRYRAPKVGPVVVLKNAIFPGVISCKYQI